MKLSEAIRLGSMLKPQAHGGLYINGGSCALGAALDAVNGLFRKNWGWTDDSYEECPVCGYGETNVVAAITHLNDNHKWTREAIADWITSIEPQDTPIVPETVAEPVCV